MKTDNWCIHIKPDYSKGYLDWCGTEYCAPYFDKNFYLMKEIKFCPICGTPRPKEKSLTEKMIFYLSTVDLEGVKIREGLSYSFIDRLANIAKEHYEGKVKT